MSDELLEAAQRLVEQFAEGDGLPLFEDTDCTFCGGDYSGLPVNWDPRLHHAKAHRPDCALVALRTAIERYERGGVQLGDEAGGLLAKRDRLIAAGVDPDHLERVELP